MNPTNELKEKTQELKDELNAVKISKYSMANADEFLAEAFANEKIGVESKEYAAKAVDVLDKYFRR